MADSRLSFIVPAHDEESVIADTIDAIRGAADAAGESYEIIVVDDASTDRTAELAGAAGARIVAANVRQIAGSRNAGAAAARGEWFVFVDADTIVNPAVVAATIDALRGGAVGGGPTVRFDEPIPRYARMAMPLAMFTYRRFGLAAGCYLFCTRTAFEAVGGFDAELYAAEEAVFSRALRKHGRVVMLRETVITSGRKLRQYPARTILGALFRLGIRGRRGVRDRSRLDLWYGPRQADPARRDRPDRP